MKKFFVLLSVVLLLSSCSCLLSQIPPQYIYVGVDCEAALPDYTTKVIATDNCLVKSLTQTPIVGTILNATNPTVTVVIRATDSFNNFSEVSFDVTALDTVPPVITYDTLAFQTSLNQANEFYDMGDRIIATLDAAIDTTLGVKPSYMNEVMVTYTTPGYAVIGEGKRVTMFMGKEDLLSIINQ